MLPENYPYDYKLSIDDVYVDFVVDSLGEPLTSVDDIPYFCPLLGDYFSWFKDGVIHREGNKDAPAVIDGDTKMWFVHGVPHREHDAYRKTPLLGFSYALYGLELEPETFNVVTAHTAKYDCPLWVSLFVALDLISDDLVNFFMKNGKWSPDLPNLWVVKLWGVSPDKITDVLYSLCIETDASKGISRDDRSIPNFLDKVEKVDAFMRRER